MISCLRYFYVLQNRKIKAKVIAITRQTYQFRSLTVAGKKDIDEVVNRLRMPGTSSYERRSFITCSRSRELNKALMSFWIICLLL